MNEDARSEAERRRQEAKRDAERQKQEIERRMKDPDLQREWIRQDNLIYGGLMGIGIVMVQPFLIAESLDRSAMICVVAWSVAIPLLAALLLVNRQETFRGRRTPSRNVAVARAVAQASAFVGLVAGFWHISWIAGTGMLVGALVAMGVHSAGFSRLELGEMPRQQEARRDTEVGVSDEVEDLKTHDQSDTPS